MLNAVKPVRAEVERLQRERDEARDRILKYTDALVERDAEIAELKAQMKEMMAMIKPKDKKAA